MPIGEIILQLLKSKGLTKVWLANEMRISRGTLDNWIRGNTSPTHKDLLKMSKILNVDSAELSVNSLELDYKNKYFECLEAKDRLRDEVDRLNNLIDELKKNVPYPENKP